MLSFLKFHLMTGYASSKCPFFHKGLLTALKFGFQTFQVFRDFVILYISIFYCFY